MLGSAVALGAERCRGAVVGILQVGKCSVRFKRRPMSSRKFEKIDDGAPLDVRIFQRPRRTQDASAEPRAE
jgi:hypothetical protein